MMWRVSAVIAAVVGLQLLEPACAASLFGDVFQSHGTKGQTDRNETGQVSILTDGLADPDSRASRAINQLAARGRIGAVRVLPVSGQGGAANARDLLRLHNVDFAVVNSDVLAFLQLTRQADGRKSLRYVTSLFDDKVFVLARRDIDALAGLRGRRLVVLSDGGDGFVTAKTLFGLSRIEVTVEMMPKGAVLDDAALRAYDGALVFGDELRRVRLGAALRDDYHLVPVALTPELRRDYRSAVIAVEEADGFATTAVDTVTVSRLLAVVNELPSQPRHADVTNFVSALFHSLKELRAAPDSVWRQADVVAQQPGWLRFPGAVPGRVLKAAQLAELAAVERPVTALAPLAPGEAATRGDWQTAPAAGAGHHDLPPHLRVLAGERPPLTDRHAGDGGLIAALLTASLRTGGRDTELEIGWKPALSRTDLAGSTVDLALPFESGDCDEPRAGGTATPCVGVLSSDPLIEVVVGVVSLADGGFDFSADEGILGRTICVSADRDAAVLDRDGRRWVADGRVSVIRRPTLIECLSLVQGHEADAVVASDLEGRYVLRQLGLQQMFRMWERPLATRGVHVVVPGDRPHAQDLVDAVNRGLRQLKGNDGWAAIVRPRLMRLWEGPLR
jgi:polar amino acid transport system substrate-binding protein